MRFAGGSKGQDAELVEFVAREYARGNHLVDGGPEIGLFWATDISGIETHRPRPFQEGWQMLSKYGGISNHRHLADPRKHSF